jgi:hypothetical protein
VYAVVLAIALGTLAFGITAAVWSPVAGILPGLLVFAATAYAAFRRINGRLEAEMRQFADHIQNKQIDAAVATLERVRRDYGRWVPGLEAQVDGSLGLLDYAQLKFDRARPQLERGRGANWMSDVALACIHWRQKRTDDAWAAFGQAAKVHPKEAMVYVVWAILRARGGQRDEALAAVGQGLVRLPDHAQLKAVQTALANQRTPDVTALGPVWQQLFPEEALAQARLAARPPAASSAPSSFPQPRVGARHAHRR